MKRYIYSTLAIFASALIIQGCTKFLDTVPDERTQLNSVDKVSALLTSAYPQVSFPALVQFRCDYVSDQGSTQTGSQPISLLSFAGEQFIWKEQTERSNDREETFWTGCYSAIAASNHALAALENLPREEGKSAMGEAYLTRAFSHFYLVSLFSKLYKPGTAPLFPGIPYVTEPEDVPIAKYERGTVEDTYSKIAADIEAGYPLLTDGAGFRAPKYHFNKTSAAAFAARFYLMKGEYANVIKYANSVFPIPTSFITIKDDENKDLMNSDGTPVVNVASSDAAISFAATNFQPIMSFANMGTAYGIMDNFVKSTNSSNLLLCEAITSLGLTYFSSYSRFGMSKTDALNLFFNNDMGTTGNCVYPAIAYSQDNLWFIPKLPYDLKKESVSASSGLPYSIMPLLRMEEILLNRAEAYVMTNELDKAIADMNLYLSQRTVFEPYTDRRYDNTKLYLSKDRALAATASDRSNSGFINQYNETSDWPELKKALIVLILRYRAQEFWQEGLRWYDICRWNIPVRHILASGESNTLAPDDDRRVLQLPEMAILAGIEKNERSNVDNVWK